MKLMIVQHNDALDEIKEKIIEHMSVFSDVEVKYKDEYDKDGKHSYAMLIVKNKDDETDENKYYLYAMASYWKEGIEGYCGIHNFRNDTYRYGHCFKYDPVKFVNNSIDTFRKNDKLQKGKQK